MADRRRTFGPVVLLGLAMAGLTTIAGNRPAAKVDGADSAAGGGLVSFDAHMPAVTALGLVVLATWGVVLVTRGRVRRAVAALGVLASAGALVSVVLAYTAVPDQLRDDLSQVGVSDASVTHTVWFWAAALGALGSLAMTLLAVAWAPPWPEMGSKYDAPTAAPAPVEVPPEEQSSLDLWKALDEGRDPTAPKTDEA